MITIAQSEPARRISVGQWTTLVGLAIVALPTPWGWIGLAVAGAGALVCPRNLIANTHWLLCRPVVWLWVLWWLVIGASISWSPDLSLSHWESLLMLLLIPAVASLRAHRNAVVIALALGISINGCVQVLQWADWMPNERFRSGWIAGGLFDYPPFAAIWMSVVLLLLLPLVSNSPTCRRALALSGLVGMCMVGTLLTTSKVSLLVGGICLLLSGSVLLVRRATPWGRAAVSAAIASTIAIAIWNSFYAKGRVARNFQSLTHEVESATDVQKEPANVAATTQPVVEPSPRATNKPTSTPAPTATRNIPSRKYQVRMQTSLGLRVLWWNATGHILMDAPVFGHGAGSTRNQLARAERTLPPDLAAGIDNFIIEDPHSSLLATAIEQGLLGATVLLSCIGTALWMCIRATIRDVRHLGLAAAWCVLCAGALVHTLQFTPWMAALGMMMIVLTAWISDPKQANIGKPQS
jgi:hypothetical protein